jgi:hypothetical protein
MGIKNDLERIGNELNGFDSEEPVTIQMILVSEKIKAIKITLDKLACDITERSNYHINKLNQLTSDIIKLAEKSNL